MASSEGKIEIPSLDGIRGIGALLVVLVHGDHYFGSFFGCGSVMFRLTGGNLHLEIIVDTFFILSGFVMNHVYGRLLAGGGGRALGAFLVARVARVLPLYFVTLIAMALIAPYSFVPPWIDLSTIALLQQATFVGFLHDKMAWNYPSWSVQVEMLCYLLFPLISIGILPRSKQWVVLAGLSLCVMALFLASRNGNLDIVVGFRSILRAFGGFTGGVFLYEAWRYGWANRYRHVFSAVGYVSLLGFLLCWQDTLLVVAQGCFVVLCLNKRSLFFGVLNAPISRWLGTISYSIYLWHAAVQFSIVALVMASGLQIMTNTTSASMLCTVLTFLPTLLVASLSFKYIEKPGRSLIRSSYKGLKEFSPPRFRYALNRWPVAQSNTRERE